MSSKEQQKSPAMEGEWLHNLQRESWQLELLVSGFAIFLLFQVPGVADYLLLRVKASTSVWLVYVATPILHLLRDGAMLLAFCLVIHVALRGIWIAMIGLESAFPQGVQQARLGFSDYFLSKRGVYENEALLHRLDDLASMVFAISFLLVGHLVSITLLFCLLTVLSLAWELTNGVTSWLGMILTPVFLAMVALKLLNLFTLGLLSRWELISKLYYPVDRFISLVSLSFVYQPVYDVLASNIHKGLVFGITLCFVGSILVYEFQVLNVHGTRLTTTFYYDDQRPKDQLSSRFSIQSDVIQTDVLKVFIPFDEAHLAFVEKNCPELKAIRFQGIRFFGSEIGLQADFMDWKEQRAYLDCVAQQYILSIDDQPVEKLRFHFKNRMEGSLLRRGFSFYVPLPENKYGEMALHVERIGKDGKARYSGVAPFWRKK